MAQVISLQLRTSNHFADGWSDLDEWCDAGTAKLLPMRQVCPGNGYEDLGIYIAHAELRPAHGVSLRQARSALAQHLSGSSCRHEYDCCGCAFRMAGVHWARGRKVAIRLSIHRNL